MADKSSLLVTKASGLQASYDVEKLKRSLTRAGAHSEVIEEIKRKLEDHLYEGISTKKIYKIAFRLLRDRARPLAARYKLKSAIMELGPSGYPFEKYVAAILKEQGYRVQTGIIVKGKCVNHEVDVIAEKDQHHFMVECKYHNHRAVVCDVKIPLYIYSRFKDVEASWVQLSGHDIKLHQGWVVTNTKFTKDAIQYGLCAGLHLVGWDFPRKGSLNETIDKLGLYPVTCLTTLTIAEKQRLLNSGVVLCMQICKDPELLKNIGLQEPRLKKVLEEGHQLCQKLTLNIETQVAKTSN